MKKLKLFIIPVVIATLTLVFPLYCFSAQQNGMYEVKSSERSSINSNQYSFPNMLSAFDSTDIYKMNYAVLPEMKKIIEYSQDFFTTIIKKNVEEATKPLFAIFPISDKSKNNLKKDIENINKKVGPMLETEYIGYRTVGNLKRYFTLYFLSYHPILPIAWELTFYKATPKSKWQLNYIRFNSDNIYEFLKYPLLKLNLMQKQLSNK